MPSLMQRKSQIISILISWKLERCREVSSWEKPLSDPALEKTQVFYGSTFSSEDAEDGRWPQPNVLLLSLGSKAPYQVLLKCKCDPSCPGAKPGPGALSTLGYGTSSSFPLGIVKTGTDCAEGTRLVPSPEPGQIQTICSAPPKESGKAFMTTQSAMGKSLDDQT